jgi:hypothetical protein
MIRKALSAILAIAFCVTAQNANLTAREARDHVSEVRTVCGKVASTQRCQQYGAADIPKSG